MYEWTQSGMPICRPLFLNDGADVRAFDYVNDQFFVGRDLLIAPIVPSLDDSGRAENAQRDVYLPANGPWYAFKDNAAPLDPPVPGGTLLSGATAWRATLDQVPMYVRAGAIIPMWRDVGQFVGDNTGGNLVYTIYPGPDRAHTSYLDDGDTPDAIASQAYRLTEVGQQTIGNSRRVRVHRLVDNYTPSEREYLLAILQTNRPLTVSINGAALPDAGSRANLDGAQAHAFYWDSNTAVTWVKVMDQLADVVIEVS
jgi:alpha-glucosidase